jgi:predicted nuclease of restriction endonuclease-like (RecB) superfamily
MGSRDRSDEFYLGLVQGLNTLLEAARRSSARAVNSVMTATYWEIGRRIVEFEQGGEARAAYGVELLERLASDLSNRFGRGFSRRNLQQMRVFYLAFPSAAIWQTPSAKSESSFPLPWSHYGLLLAKTRSKEALAFYHAEALRGGWTVRQLQRQLNSQFYERTALSKNKPAMLTKGGAPRAEDAVSADEEVKDPMLLEFLGLKDEYSESDLEEALVRHLESFLMELGGDFAFVGRQRRLRIGNAWFPIDLLFFHRRLRCLVVIELKIGEFTPADAGQMNVYLNYAREHWIQPGENPPVGLILTLKKDEALAHYALEGLKNTVLAREYRLVLPDEKRLVQELEATRKRWERTRSPTTPVQQPPLFPLVVEEE